MVSKEKPRQFAHLDVEKAAYRAIMRKFVEAKARFAIHLRSADVLHALGGDGRPYALVDLEASLKQLCVWGNLEDHPDTAEATTVEEFYHPPRPSCGGCVPATWCSPASTGTRRARS